MKCSSGDGYNESRNCVNRNAKITRRIAEVTSVAATTIIAAKIDAKSRTADTNKMANANKTADTATNTTIATKSLRNVGTICRR